MIVKVQLSISSSDKKRRVLIYNKARDYQWEGPVSKALLDELHSAKRLYVNFKLEKSFWFAEAIMNPRKKGEKASYVINLIAPAPWKEW